LFPYYTCSLKSRFVTQTSLCIPKVLPNPDIILSVLSLTPKHTATDCARSCTFVRSQTEGWSCKRLRHSKSQDPARSAPGMFDAQTSLHCICASSCRTSPLFLTYPHHHPTMSYPAAATAQPQICNFLSGFENHLILRSCYSTCNRLSKF
jgi:hypothetical protein